MTHIKKILEYISDRKQLRSNFTLAIKLVNVINKETLSESLDRRGNLSNGAGLAEILAEYLNCWRPNLIIVTH